MTSQSAVTALRKRRLKIVALSGGIVICLLGLLFSWMTVETGFHTVNRLASAESSIGQDKLHEALPSLLAKHTELGVAISWTRSLSLLLAAMLGLLIAGLILELTGQSYDRRIAELTNRVEELEKKMGMDR